MIEELLDCIQVRAQRDATIRNLRDFAGDLIAEREPARKAKEVIEKKYPESEVTPEKLIAAADALEREKDKELAREAGAHPEHDGAYIPSAPLTCLLQSHLEKEAMELGLVEDSFETGGELKSAAPVSRRMFESEDPNRAVPVTSKRLRPRTVLSRHGSGGTRWWEEVDRTNARGLFGTGTFIDGADPRYVSDGAYALAIRAVTGRAPFNPNPARTANLGDEARVLLFGDWATGVNRAQTLAIAMSEALQNYPVEVRQHLIHLGDTYYVGWDTEYKERFLPWWPNLIAPGRGRAATSWSLNGNHDMYSGGWGYFDTLLRHPEFLSHLDDADQPSSFFLLQNARWQIFGLDSAYYSPELQGMSGAIDLSQLKFIRENLDPNKGVILLTHHELLSSPQSKHPSTGIRDALVQAGVWPHVNAWIWGHEHRGVLYDGAWTRQQCGLPFAACLGNAGVPVKAPNTAPAYQPGVAWEYSDSLLDSNGDRFARFGFASLKFSAAHPDEVKVIFHGDDGQRLSDPLLHDIVIRR